MDLQDINIPEDPILCGAPMGDIVSNRVPPRWQSTISPEEVPVAGLELHLSTIPERLPLDGGIEPPRQALNHFAASDAEQERLVGRREILAIAALEADDVVVLRHVLHDPLGVLGGAVPVLAHRLLVLLRL